MATVNNLNKGLSFNTQVITSVADVTSKFDEGQFRYNYTNGGIDIDFDSPAAAPASGDYIVLSDQSSQFNYLMTAADYAIAGIAL